MTLLREVCVQLVMCFTARGKGGGGVGEEKVSKEKKVGREKERRDWFS